MRRRSVASEADSTSEFQCASSSSSDGRSSSAARRMDGLAGRSCCSTMRVYFFG